MADREPTLSVIPAAETGAPIPVGGTRLFAPAKLTVSLRIEDVRSDGFHLLDAEMISIDLCDVLDVDPGGDGLELVDGGHGAADGSRSLSTGEDNLVVRSLARVGRTAGVRLHKRIPVGGGLGGGSSDAAAILRWAGCHDAEVAVELGADVPFCLAGGRARVSGIGENVVPLPFELRTFVLLIPPFGVDTAAVYRAWDELAEAGGPVAEGDNHLTGAAMVVQPALAEWGEVLARLTGLTPTLAGSGSTWFVETTQAAPATPTTQATPTTPATPTRPTRPTTPTTSTTGASGAPSSDRVGPIPGPNATTEVQIKKGGESARLVTVKAVPADWPGW